MKVRSCVVYVAFALADAATKGKPFGWANVVKRRKLPD
jgi:hypothetical protein